MAVTLPDSLADGWLEFACGSPSCSHIWRETIPLPLLMVGLIKRLKSYDCPACGSTAVYFVNRPEPEAGA